MDRSGREEIDVQPATSDREPVGTAAAAPAGLHARDSLVAGRH
jgi:proline racemase